MPNRVLLLSISAAAIWWTMLGLLALLTANPVTLNDTQIRQADYVVSARVEDLASSSIHVQKEWKHGALLGTIPLKNLKQIGVENGSIYLIPLTRQDDDQFSVVTTLKRTASREKQVLPHDGLVIDGLATVSERSRTTGLFEEVLKRRGDTVRAGSLLKNGRLTVESPMQGEPFVYPATEAAIQQLESILHDMRATKR